MSKPSGAMVMVAAMPNTVVIDMARRMLIMLLTERKRSPLMNPNTTKHRSSVRTAAQSSKKRNTVLVFFVASGFGLSVACIMTSSCYRLPRSQAYLVVLPTA